MVKLNSKGETIVEVLISIVVVGSVLAGAYFTANRSSQQTRAAIERTEALKAAESKVEMLRNLSKTPGLNLASGVAYCIEASAATVSTTCKVEPRYNVLTKLVGETYSITAEWDSVLGSKEKLTMYYRL